MSKIKSFLTDTLGGFGVVLFFGIAIVCMFMPLKVFIDELNSPSWLNFIIIAGCLVLSKITLPIIWTVGLFFVIPSFDWFAVIYYVIYLTAFLKDSICLVLSIPFWFSRLFNNN